MELDDTTTGSLDSIDVENDMTGAPHIYHGYECPIRADLINRGEGFPDILPGDLLVFFDGCYCLDEFCSDANEMDDIFGINYDLVYTSFDFGESKNSKGKGRPVIKGMTIDHDINGDTTLDVKVYRRDQSGEWRSVLKLGEQPWQGWLPVERCNFESFGNSQDEGLHSSDLKESADLFMLNSFKPEYKRFVRRMRKWNRRFQNNLGLEDSLDEDRALQCQQLGANQFINESTGTLAGIAASIGRNHDFGDRFDRRNFSFLYLFIRQFHDQLIRK